MKSLAVSTILVFLTSCAFNPSSPPSPPTSQPPTSTTSTPLVSPSYSPSPSSNIREESLKMLNGSWLGKYNCNQGITKLLLVITTTGLNIDAVFNFSADESNPTVPSGSFRMSGTYDPNSRKLALKATNWIDKPINYLTVDFEGLVSPTEKSMAGNILGPNCSAFALTKIQ